MYPNRERNNLFRFMNLFMEDFVNIKQIPEVLQKVYKKHKKAQIQKYYDKGSGVNTLQRTNKISSKNKLGKLRNLDNYVIGIKYRSNMDWNLVA